GHRPCHRRPHPRRPHHDRQLGRRCPRPHGQPGQLHEMIPPLRAEPAMQRLLIVLLVFGIFSADQVTGADLKVFPPEIVLTGPQASQRLIVLAESEGKLIADLTPQSKFSSSNSAVAAVDESGVIRAAGDGEAVVTVLHEGKQTTVKVKASRTKEPA